MGYFVQIYIIFNYRQSNNVKNIISRAKSSPKYPYFIDIPRFLAE